VKLDVSVGSIPTAPLSPGLTTPQLALGSLSWLVNTAVVTKEVHMTQGLDGLSDDEQALLQFVLDSTIEQWKEELPTSQQVVELDPSITSLEEMLALTGGQAELITMLETVRSKILEDSRG
jgi:hypothetical protein